MKRVWWFTFVLLVNWWPGPTWVLAQDSTGTIEGTVTDSLGRPIIAAAVVIPGTRHGATADTVGHYAIPSIRPGVVTLLASRIGVIARLMTASRLGVDM